MRAVVTVGHRVPHALTGGSAAELIGNRMHPVRKDFDRHTASLFALLCLCFAAAIIGDNAAEALLLAHVDPSLLPKMFLCNAAALFVASGVVMRVIDRVDRGALFVNATFGHAGVLLLARWALEFEAAWLYPALYSYAYIAKILLFLLFWTLANDLIDSRAAQKKFPLIAAGGTLGAIAVAFTVPAAVRMVATENLLVAWSGLSFALGCVFCRLRARAGRAFTPVAERERQRGSRLFCLVNDLRMVAADPLLSRMASVYGLIFFLLIMQQYYFYLSIKSHFGTAAAIAGFLGLFSGASMAVTLALQLSVAGAVLRKFGSSRAILLLPLAFFAIFTIQSFAAQSGGGAFSGSFVVTVIAAMGFRIAMFDAFFSPNFQVFFSSLPQELRGRAKLTMEGVVKPAAILCGGLWLIGVAPHLSVFMNMTLCAVCAALLLLMTLGLKDRYAASLVRFLSGVATRATGSVPIPSRQPARERMKQLFDEGNFAIRAFLIDELVVSGVPEMVSLVMEQVRHADARIRATAVAALGNAVQPEAADAIRSCLDDADARVVANAVIALGRCRPADASALIQGLLGHTSARVRTNVMVVMWQTGDGARLPQFLDRLESMLRSDQPEECASALFALGEIESRETDGRLLSFSRDADPERLTATMPVFRQLCGALAKKHDDAALEELLRLAGMADRSRKREITVTIASKLRKGEPPERLLLKTSVAMPQRTAIILRAIDESAVRLQDAARRSVRELALKEHAAIAGELESVSHLARFADNPGATLLRYAIIDEKIAMRKTVMAHALSLCDKSGAIRSVVPRLFHAQPHVRARALEVLDNAGDASLNRAVMGVFDHRSEKPADEAAEVPGRPAGPPLREFLERYTHDSDAWIRKCAAFAACWTGLQARPAAAVETA